ncbi:MAG TPA: M1 family metallopeptidase [Myxococcaceae bacterium]|nr:M1 family metallopeptidase [Myxococcaceae bacterium]
MARLDPHSYTDDQQPQTRELEWRARVDFTQRTLECEVSLVFEQPGEGPLDLDTRELTIHEVTDPSGAPLRFELAPADPVLGARLRLELPAGTRKVRIRYRTSPGASALQWLTPAQTFGGKEPFLFSQCQQIHARSIIPLQDTPKIRVRYGAELVVPSRLKAVMAAALVSREENGDEAVERFEMPQPIPSYLIALAVGDLKAKEVGPRSRVWAEPGVLEQAAWEFAEVDEMIRSAERLFGPYDWDRFDVLAMPPSFPYGGMENPRLTFITPTVIAGDRSLVSVVAHELAHSWTGNLVTNATLEHFWLNEGFTVYAERRILEALYGPELAALHAALGRRSLNETIEGMKDRPALTLLRTQLEGLDPDEVFSQVPYEKGYLFLKALEDAAGRERFNHFVRGYVEEFRFRSITTEEFLAFVEHELPGVLEKVDAKAWVFGPGVPQNAPAPRSAKLEALERHGTAVPNDATAKAWSPTEWELYLKNLPHPSPLAVCEELDRRFGLTTSRNHEVLVTWLELATLSGHAPALPRVEQVLQQVGRMKYLRPLYRALAKTDPVRARGCFERFRDGYHPIARQVVEGLLKKAAVA